jgi:hypothetical protein
MTRGAILSIPEIIKRLEDAREKSIKDESDANWSNPAKQRAYYYGKNEAYYYAIGLLRGDIE